VGQLSNADAMTVVSVADRLLAKGGSLSSISLLVKISHTTQGDERKMGIIRFHTLLNQVNT
jgi:hypothetical protein